MHASAETFCTPMGVFSTSAITPAMLKALDSVDDAGCIIGSSQTIKKLIQLGLAKDGLNIRITRAGWNAAALFPLPNEHKVRYVHGREPVDLGEKRYDFRGRLVEQTWVMFSAYCSCGWYYHGEEQGRRYAVKQHKRWDYA